MDKNLIITYESNTEEDTAFLGRAIGRCLREGDILLLNGDLAAGKTALSRSIFSERGYEKGFCSPTFSIINVYVNGDKSAAHMDLYRIADPEELLYTGFYDVIDTAEFSVIEWPGPVEEEFPERTTGIDIEVDYVTGRRIFTVRPADRELYDHLREELEKC